MSKVTIQGTAPMAASANTLDAWLKQQATKLKSIEACGHRLKLDFVENARDKGEILIDVKKRLAETAETFEMWVTANTGIGYSTAQLYMDVARNFKTVKEKFAHSNGLEVTLRQVRDAIRDARQERGEGKPGSGRRKATESQSAGTDGRDDGDKTGNDSEKWEREVAAAEEEAGAHEGGQKTEAAHYKMTIMVFSESDQVALQQALSNWSPVTKPLANKKHAYSVTVTADLGVIGDLLTKLGTTLQQSQPQKVRVSIER